MKNPQVQQPILDMQSCQIYQCIVLSPISPKIQELKHSLLNEINPGHKIWSWSCLISGKIISGCSAGCNIDEKISGCL